MQRTDFSEKAMTEVVGLETSPTLDGTMVRVNFVTSDGQRMLMKLSDASLRDAISVLIAAATPVPQHYVRSENQTVEDNPIRPEKIAISPISDSPDYVRLTLACGRVDLQFGVSKDELLRQLGL